jgi:hypothetical protein
VPAAEAYDAPSSFVGTWLGEVDSLSGTLTLKDLGGGRMYGVFLADGEATTLSLSGNQATAAPAPELPEHPANLLEFTWQDGRGGKGRGFLLVNREDTALTGSHGFDTAALGAGEWTFIRLE